MNRLLSTTLRSLRRSPLWRDARHHLCDSFYANPVPMTPQRLARLLVTPEFKILIAVRIYCWLYRHGHRLAAYLLYQRTRSRFACDISYEAEIGPGIRIVHAVDVVIGGGARLGADVVVFNGVTLGNRLSADDPLGMPLVGDRVLLGAGAKLLGSIEVGDGARIGANAVVLASVPAGATAVGNPARIVFREGRMTTHS